MAARTVTTLLGLPGRWHEDRVVWAAVFLSMASTGYVVFAGRYLPYQDWAGHVGLSSVLATGHDTGADQYLAQSLLPTPYLLFYLVTAGWAAIGLAEIGAKLNLLIATGMMVIAAARLAESTGRDPRMCVLAPIALFGVSLGMGFSSFVFALPLLFFVLADLEWLLRSLRLEDPVFEREGQVRSILLSVGITLCFLGHGLLFVFASMLVWMRLVVHVAKRIRTDQRAVARAIGSVTLGYVPTLLLSLPSLFRRLDHAYVAPEFREAGWPGFVDFDAHIESFGRDLLDRGGDGHEVTAILLGLVFVVWLVVGIKRPSSRRYFVGSIGLLVYLSVMILVFVLGPDRFGWPVTFWVVYQRAGSIALLLLLLFPTPELGGKRGALIASLGLLPVLHNAMVNAETVREFSAWAEPYERVRQVLPPKQRVLPLSEPRALGPFPNAGNSLGYYHLVDGAAYVPIGRIPEEMPVHRKEDVPRPPFFTPRSFDPELAADNYDYAVLLGDKLLNRALRSGRFDDFHRSGRWTVLRSRPATKTSSVAR